MESFPLQLNLLGKYPDLAAKVEASLDIIGEAFKRWRPDEIGISFNGGKDSVVLVALILRAVKTLQLQEVDNGFKQQGCTGGVRTIFFLMQKEYPELLAFMKHFALEYQLEVTEFTCGFKQGLEELIRGSDAGVSSMKAIFMGTRKDDPDGEGQPCFSPTDPSWPQIMRVNPILDWHYEEVWRFILTFNLPYCSLYDRGFTSIGAIDDTTANELLWVPRATAYAKPWLLRDGRAERRGRGCRKYFQKTGFASFLDYPSTVLANITAYVSVFDVCRLYMTGSSQLRRVLTNGGVTHVKCTGQDTRKPRRSEKRSAGTSDFSVPSAEVLQHCIHDSPRVCEDPSHSNTNGHNHSLICDHTSLPKPMVSCRPGRYFASRQSRPFVTPAEGNFNPKECFRFISKLRGLLDVCYTNLSSTSVTVPFTVSPAVIRKDVPFSLSELVESLPPSVTALSVLSGSMHIGNTASFSTASTPILPNLRKLSLSIFTFNDYVPAALLKSPYLESVSTSGILLQPSYFPTSSGDTSDPNNNQSSEPSFSALTSLDTALSTPFKLPPSLTSFCHFDPNLLQQPMTEILPFLSSNLTSLSISGYTLQGAPSFTHLPQLKNLSLDSVLLTDLLDTMTLVVPETLVTLSITSNLTPATVERLLTSNSFPSLQRLVLRVHHRYSLTEELHWPQSLQRLSLMALIQTPEPLRRLPPRLTSFKIAYPTDVGLDIDENPDVASLLPTSLTSLSTNWLVSDESIPLLPRQLRKLTCNDWKVPENQGIALSAETIGAWPAPLTSLKLTVGSPIVGKYLLMRLSATLKVLHIIGDTSISDQDIPHLPRALESLVLPLNTNRFGSSLKKLPSGIKKLHLPNATLLLESNEDEDSLLPFDADISFAQVQVVEP